MFFETRRQKTIVDYQIKKKRDSVLKSLFIWVSKSSFDIENSNSEYSICPMEKAGYEFFYEIAKNEGFRDGLL